MTYNPINIPAYVASYSGAVAGMGVSGWIVDPAQAHYDLVTQIAGAFAQAFDVAWNDAVQLNNLELAAITALVSSQFQERGPGPLENPVFHTVENWDQSARAAIALILESDVYFAGQGINPGTPAVVPPSAFIIRDNIAALIAEDSLTFPNGCTAFVISEGVNYILDTLDPLTTYHPLIVERGAVGAIGKWYRISRSDVVGNYTLWLQWYGYGTGLNDGGIVGYTPGQLLASGNQEPDIILQMGNLIDGLGNQQGILADVLGNLWLIVNDDSFNTVNIYKFPLKECVRSGAPTATVHLAVPLFPDSEAGGAVFDTLSGLWAMSGSHGTFGSASWAQYSQRSYSVDNATPSYTLKLDSDNTAYPGTSNQQDLEFDGQGNLWGSCAFSAGINAGAGFGGAIFMLTPSQLYSGPATNVHAAKLWRGANVAPDGSLGWTGQIAIGPKDNLIWLTDYHGAPGSVRAFDMSQPSGNPAPVIVLTCAQFNIPYGIDFDSGGNLWINNGLDNKLMRIPASQLGASGVVVPDVVINPSLATNSKITFAKNSNRSGLLPSGWPPG